MVMGKIKLPRCELKSCRKEYLPRKANQKFHTLKCKDAHFNGLRATKRLRKSASK